MRVPNAIARSAIQHMPRRQRALMVVYTAQPEGPGEVMSKGLLSTYRHPRQVAR